MTAAVSSISGASHAQGPISQSLTDLCRTGSSKEALEAIEKGKKPDRQTLESACKRLEAARQRCGSFDPSCEEYVSYEVRDRQKITFTVLEGKIDSSLDDFSLEIGLNISCGKIVKI